MKHERDLMLRASDALTKITGMRPVGLRTPSWDFSPSTLRIQKEMGLLYDSSLMADEDCYELLLHGEPSGVIEMPVEWVRDDAVYFMMNRFQAQRPYTPPTDVFDIFRREFDAAYDEGGIFQLTCHPHIIGYRSRIWILDELIRHAKAKKDVWFATHEEVVRWAKAHAGLALRRHQIEGRALRVHRLHHPLSARHLHGAVEDLAAACLYPFGAGIDRRHVEIKAPEGNRHRGRLGHHAADGPGRPRRKADRCPSGPCRCASALVQPNILE